MSKTPNNTQLETKKTGVRVPKADALGTFPNGYSVNQYNFQNPAPKELQDALRNTTKLIEDENMLEFVGDGAGPDTLHTIYQLRARVNELEIMFHEAARTHVAAMKSEIETLESLGLLETPDR